MLPDGMTGTARFSRCKRFRYDLTRTWDESKGTCSFICLNPSTATEVVNDPTVTRCINYAMSWGYGRFVMLNAYAFRSTDPAGLKTIDDPVGAENDYWIDYWAQRSKVVVAAWGIHCADDRQAVIKGLVPDLHYLRKTKSGAPGHPLYLPRTLTPRPFTEGEP